jgi:lactate permease
MSQVWSQSYTLFGRGLAVSSLIACIPIVTLLFLLGVRRKPAWFAALWALLAASLVALFAYKLPPVLTISSAAYGAGFGLFPISWIVLWAIILYRITVEKGKFEIIKTSMGNLTGDARLQALLIAFAFGAFVEGAAGFGTPVAVAAAMLVGLGFSPFYASALCLVANTAPVAFGSIGIPVITLAGLTGLPLDKLSAAVGRICAPLSLFVPCYLVCVMVGWRGMLEVWPAVALVGGVFASMQFFMSNFVGPALTDIMSSLCALSALLLLLRFWKPAKQWDRELEPVVPPKSGRVAEKKFSAMAQGSSNIKHTAAQMCGAWMPYALLVILVLLWGFKPFQAILNKATISIGWPMLQNHVMMMPPVVAKPTVYKALYQLNFLSAAGTACMFAAILSAILLRMSPVAFCRLFVSVCRQLFLPTLTVTAVLAMAFVMNYSGATATLGLAFAASGRLFPFFSPLLGWMGVFLTGSDTSANALFGTLQVVTASRLGFEPTLMAAANSAGGVVGKMISVQNIAVAAAATAMTVSDQAKLFRFTLRHSMIMAVAIGVEVMLYAYIFHVG